MELNDIRRPRQCCSDEHLRQSQSTRRLRWSQCQCDRGEAEGKEAPTVAIGVERLSTAGSLQVCGGRRVTTNQGRAGGTREPGEAERSRVEPRVGGAKVMTGRRAELERREQRPEVEP